MIRSTPNLRKAAVLVASLDRENAEKVLRQLPSDQAALVRRAAAELREINPAEQEMVIAEFFRIGPVAPEPVRTSAPPRTAPMAQPLNDPHLAGIELDGSLAGRFARPQPKPVEAARVASALDGLEHLDCGALVPLLEQEHPQTIAVAVSHLPHVKAAELLAALPAGLQAEVLQRLTHLDELDPESLHEVERQLERWIAQQSRSRAVRSAGLSAVAEILRAASPQAREKLVTNLRRRDGLLADRLAERRPGASYPNQPELVDEPVVQTLPFEHLLQLDEASLAHLLRTAEPELVVLALAGADPARLERFLRPLEPHEAAALRRDLQQLGPTRLSDVEAAQHELALLGGQLLNQRRLRTRPTHPSVAA